MKLTILATLLTVSLVTAAGAAEQVPLPAAPAAAAPPATSPAAAPPAVAAPPPAEKRAEPAAAPSGTPSLLVTKPELLGPLATAAPPRYGYIDFQKISQESTTALKARKGLTATGEKLKKQLTAKGKKLEELKKKLESQAPKMNQLEQEAKTKDFQAKVKEYQEAVQNAEKEMQKLEETAGRKLVDQVTRVVKQYGEQNGYTMILTTRDILYFNGNSPLDDVTAEVIKLMDK